MAGNSRSSSPNSQLLIQQNEIQNNPEQQSSDSSTMADFTTNTPLPTSTSNLNSVSNTKETVEGYNTFPGPRSSTLRPTTLRKQRSRRPSFQSDQVTPDMRPVLHLFDVFSQKIYIEGYLCKQEINSSNNDWIEYYVELCGPFLSFWKTVNDPDSEITRVSQTPSVINISNSSIDLSQDNCMNQRMHVFFLDSGQGEKSYLQTSDDKTLNLWVNAIRLSCFEGSRLQEVYTATLIRRPGLKDFGNGTVLMKGKLEGYLQVQFSGNLESKKYWVVVADHRAEEKKKKDLAFTRGQALFYETKRSKKPFMTVANVLQTYAIYPESPSLIEKTVTFRVEGTLFLTKPTENKPGDFAILTTDSLNEMTKWLFGFFDSFKLYGRPKELLYDFKDPISPFFAVPTGRNNTKLFLDLNEIEHVEVRESLADVKAAFAEILRQSYNLQSPDNSQQLLTSVNQQKNLSIQILPQIVTDGLSDDYVRQRAISGESTTSSTSSISPTTLRPVSQSSRPNSMTGGSQKGSIPTSPISPHSPLAPNIMSSQEQSKKRSKKPAKQLASSDESEDQQEDNNSPIESENSDDENDDPTLLKNTQENAKILEKIKTDEQINFGSSLGTFEDTDLMSEIMTAVAVREDEPVTGDASTKPKRRVSFKNQPAKQKGKNKQRLAPLPSDSEDSYESEGESSMTKSDENNSDEDSSEDSSLKNKNVIAKPGHKGNNKKTKTRIVPQPSDSSDDNEELNDDDKKFGAQPQPRPYRQSPPYGSVLKQPRVNIIPQVQQHLYPQGSFENDVNDNIPLGRNPVRNRNILTSENVADEFRKGDNQQDDYQFEMSTVGLDIDFSAINFDIATNEPANNTIEIVNKSKKGKKTGKVFKPTKQKDKPKNATRQNRSSDISSDESETKSTTSEEEPLAALVEEGVGFNANFGRQNITPRSISPNYLPNQRWGGPPIPGDYVENFGYPPIDNRRSVMTPLIRGGEYYDEDYVGGRPRSMINPGPMMAGRRRVSSGQIDYTRESLYLDDSYDDRGQFQTPSHFRPISLIDSRPPSQQLSAREQEFLARETGAPLINLQERQKDPQTGLVGAITARENQRRAKAMMVEREREFLYNRQSYTGLPVGVDPRSSRFLGSQQYLEPIPGQRGSYHENYVPYIQSDDEDDDVPLAVGNSIPPTIPPTQSRQPRAMRNRRLDPE
ncbi:12897_t:CDS:2 [Funneliformis mosseae]|uniref:12897_t:CDS:1 n=1 Tax=Funneliformis mosseae TaxID=27381 RepID=A0A9N9FP93_FUNMO|nr:12897_t:CDS:2 [Funneliformis mosseae]